MGITPTDFIVVTKYVKSTLLHTTMSQPVNCQHNTIVSQWHIFSFSASFKSSSICLCHHGFTSYMVSSGASLDSRHHNSTRWGRELRELTTTGEERRNVWSNVIAQCETGSTIPWWRHQMETVSALLVLCAGNSPVTGDFPAQSPGTRSFDTFFDLPLNKRLSKQPLGWWFETPIFPLWRHCNDSS